MQQQPNQHQQAPPRLAKPRPLGPTRSADVSDIVRDIKGLEIDFQAVLETKEPWSPEVESQRQTIRSRNLTLLFSYPLQVPAARLETLWTTTTYSLITIYRKRITSIQDSLGPLQQHRASNRGGRGQSRGGSGGGTGPVELRKVLQKFKQFLGREKEFWQGVCGRMVRSFGLKEGRKFMAGLGVHIADGMEGGEVAGMTTDQRMEKAGMLQKGMIFLGDLERYREMYTKPERERQNRNASMDVKRYDKADVAYRLASSMLPDTGNPFNQLAILPSNASDPLAATYFYLRAISVLHPFVTSRKNLENTLRRPLNVWKAAKATAAEKAGEGGDREGVEVVEVAKDDAGLKSQIVVLLAGFVFKSSSPLSLAPKILSAFRALLISCSLSSSTIFRTLISSIAIFSDLRRTRPSSRHDSTNDGRLAIPMPVFSFIVGLIEMLMEVAMIEIRETLPSGNGNGTEGEKEEKKNPLQGWEGQDIPSATDGSNLARLSPHLTPTLRRILPVLRIAFKWLERKPHTPYLGQSLDGRPPTPLDALASNSSHLDAILVRVAAVHATHASFANLLLETFPPTELKRLTMPLEEDVELKGFQPLRRKKTHAGERVQGNEEEGKDDHPNEVELMRIWSLVNDAWGMTKIEKSGISFENGRFVALSSPRSAISSSVPVESNASSIRTAFEPAPPNESTSPVQPVQPVQPIPSISPSNADLLTIAAAYLAPSDKADPQLTSFDAEDTSSSASGIDHDLLDSVSVSTDDPVNRAMRAALEDGESVSAGTEEGEMDEGDDGEEQILWQPTTSGDTTAEAKPMTTPIPSRLFPPTSATASPSGFTAHDLLRQMSSSRPSPSSSASYLTAPQTSSSALPRDAALRGASPSPQRRPSSSGLLFGPGVRTRSSSSQNLSSIWGPSPIGIEGGIDEGVQMASNGGDNPYRGAIAGGLLPPASHQHHHLPLVNNQTFASSSSHNHFSSLANNLNSSHPSSPFRDQSLTPIQQHHPHQSMLSPGPRHLNPNPLAQQQRTAHGSPSPFGFPTSTSALFPVSFSSPSREQPHERYTSYDSIVQQQQHQIPHARYVSAPQHHHPDQPHPPLQPYNSNPWS